MYLYICTNTNTNANFSLALGPAARRIFIVLKWVPIIVCGAYLVVNDYLKPKQSLLSRASNSTLANIDGFSTIWLV